MASLYSAVSHGSRRSNARHVSSCSLTHPSNPSRLFLASECLDASDDLISFMGKADAPVLVIVY